MKNIFLVLGMGINERGWSRQLSHFGRVTLIQVGLVEHVEVWEHGKCVHCGPEERLTRWWKLDQVLLGAITVWRTLRLILRSARGDRIDLIVAAAYCQALPALALRLVGKADKFISFVADYLPVRGPVLKRLHRLFTGALTRWVTRHADEAWALSPRIHAVHVNPRHFVVPICVSDSQATLESRNEVAYIGFPSEDHALDVLFDVCGKHHLPLNVIGDSAYLRAIKHLAPPWTVFHGILNEESRIHQILGKCFCGYAVYRETSPTSYSYYGFPSKAFYCLANNVPVLTTNVAHFSHKFGELGIGQVIEPVVEQIEEAILQFRRDYLSYYHAIDRFRVAWNADVEKFHRSRFSELWCDQGRVNCDAALSGGELEVDPGAKPITTQPIL